LAAWSHTSAAVPREWQRPPWYMARWAFLLPIVLAAAHSQGRSNLRRDLQATEVWVPIAYPGEALHFYNPATGARATRAPEGAQVAEQAKVWSAASGLLQAPPTEWHDGQLIPNHLRKSCVPHCTWNCTQPICEQDCQPTCHRPRCETRCPKATAEDYKQCQVMCDEPVCQMYCPKPRDPCHNQTTLDCKHMPKCNTRCEDPRCNWVCNHEIGCKTVCPDPVCEWTCRQPKVCPKPECNLVCEKPPQCDVHPTIAPAEKSETVVDSGLADRGSAKYNVADWGHCSSSCGRGVQHREVVCSTGYDADCDVAQLSRPDQSRPCQDYAGCEWVVGEWSPCTAVCGTAVQTRRVTCMGRRCLQAKPSTQQQCVDDGPDCHTCKVILYGGPNFDGWSLDFPVGEYYNSDMEARGAKCDDVSSLQVVGHYCHMRGYAFADFNERHPGWEAEFGEGRYNVHEMVAKGAKDNDLSSLKVFEVGRPAVSSGPSVDRQSLDSTGVVGSATWKHLGPFRNPFSGVSAASMFLVGCSVFSIV